MNIAVTGATGFVGSALVRFLTSQGHNVVRVERSRNGGFETIPCRDELDGIVHLAGEKITGAKWTHEKKAEIFNSRVDGTRAVCEIVSGWERPPAVIVCASAIGFYGDRGDQILTEESQGGSLFISGVCQKWEAATAVASDRGVRVVNLRFGMIIGAGGGALAEMLPVFRKGVGGKLGSGNQYVSWVSMDDVVAAVQHVLTNVDLHGPVNVTSPEPVTNKVLTKTLGHVVHRPTFIPMPVFPMRLAFGELADELLLASLRVAPARLIKTGFCFKYPRLDDALRSAIDGGAVVAARK